MVGHDPYRYVAALPSEPALPCVTICRRCGVVAPAQGTTCEVCKKPLAETRVQVPSQAADAYWVAVRCGFSCNSCRFLAPLDCLDADGAVDCAHCGLRQRFDVGSWGGALAMAHAVGDLAGPGPEGRSPHAVLWIGSENPHAMIGATRTFEQLGGNAGSALSVSATPGHPVCARCHVPVNASVVGPGRVATACAGCGERASYAIPEASMHLYEGLVGVIADEHRTDRPKAHHTSADAGAVALACPACGAPLHVEGTDLVQMCGFCNATCLIPTRAITRLQNRTPEPSVWWILFHGPSKQRADLEAPTAVAGPPLKTALNFVKPSKGEPIGESPGVYEAEVARGIDWPQVLLTLVLGSVALLVGYLVLGA